MNPEDAETPVAFLGGLQLGFLIMKIFGGSSWSWLWVLSPLWGATGLLFILYGMGAAHKALFD